MGTAPGGHVFVSYSRRQFYAARELAVALAGQGLDVWFDALALLLALLLLGVWYSGGIVL